MVATVTSPAKTRPPSVADQLNRLKCVAVATAALAATTPVVNAQVATQELFGGNSTLISGSATLSGPFGLTATDVSAAYGTPSVAFTLDTRQLTGNERVRTFGIALGSAFQSSISSLTFTELLQTGGSPVTLSSVELFDNNTGSLGPVHNSLGAIFNFAPSAAPGAGSMITVVLKANEAFNQDGSFVIPYFGKNQVESFGVVHAIGLANGESAFVRLGTEPIPEASTLGAIGLLAGAAAFSLLRVPRK